jgi:hypothetical protein
MNAVQKLVPLAIVAAATIWPSAARPQEPDPWTTMNARFDGTWVGVVSPAEARRTIDAAIEQAVSAMNYFVRPVARPMIRDNTPVNLEIELRFREANNIYVRFDDRANYTTPLGRTRRVQTPEGDAMRVTQRFRGETLEQVFQTDQGTRWNVFTSIGENRIRMDATTQGEMMPQPMHFALTYRRQ